MERKYCVYVHTNKTNGKRYVGITCRKPEERWRGGSSYKHNSHFYRSICKYGWDGFEHKVLMWGLSKEEACQWERSLIALFDCANPKRGYNVGLGGEGANSFSKSTKKRMSDIHKRRYLEHPELIEENRRQRLEYYSNPDNVEKNRKTQKLYIEQHPEKRYVNARKINQYDLSGHYMKTWKSIADATKAYGTFNSRVFSGGYAGKTCFGYQWRYADEVDGTNDIDPVHFAYEDTKRVKQYSLDGVLIKTWKQSREAAQNLHISQGNIIACCLGNRDKASNFMWRYAENESRYYIEPYRDKRNRKVEQFDKLGNHIRSYESIKEAALITGVAKTGITGVCKGINKTAGGYIWRYSDELQNKAI